MSPGNDASTIRPGPPLLACFCAPCIIKTVDDRSETIMHQETPPAPPVANSRWPNLFQRWRLPGKGNFSGAGFESPRYLTKWLVLSVTIGVVAGLGAVVFFSAIQWATDFFLVILAGYTHPRPSAKEMPASPPF